MKYVEPVTVTDAVLVASDVPEEDYPAWALNATYAVGARVILTSTHRVYESVVANNTGKDPASTPAAWLDVGATNRWAMFDQAVGSQTTATNQITVMLAPGVPFDALAVLDTDASLVRVLVTNANGDRVIEQTKAGPGVGSELSSVLFFGLPSRPNLTVTITLTAAGTFGVGTLLFGKTRDLGTTETSPTIGINDFSRRESDEFGFTTIVERGWAKRMALKTQIENGQVDAVQRQLARLRAKPVLWIGGERFDSLTIYGFFKEFSIDLQVGAVSHCSISIEGFTDGGTTPAATTPPVTTDPPVINAGIHNRYYSAANEKVLAGESGDGGRFWRAVMQVLDPDSANFGKRLALDVDAGSWKDAVPIVDPTTGGAMPPEFLRRKGAWIINHPASYVDGTARVDPRTGVALVGNLASGLWIEGEPGRTIVCKGEQNIHNLFFVKPAKIGAYYDLDERFSVVRDITIKNLVTLDEVYRWGFFESMAMIRASGVDGLTIEGIQSYGHRGDWLDIAMSDLGSVEVLRPDGTTYRKNTENYHNANVVVRDCFIHGYNKNNRNPITTLDCDGLLVERVHTLECCKPGGGQRPVGDPLRDTSDPMRADTGLQMPSSLWDGEPNIEVLNPILRGVTVQDCSATDGGGDGINVFVRANADIPNPQQGFRFTGNEFTNIRSGLAVFAVENSATPYHIVFENNGVRRCRRAYQILRSETLFIRFNLFEDCEHYADAGYEIAPGVFLPMAHSEIVGNTYRRCGSEGAGAMVIHASDNLLVGGNTFDRCSGAGYIHRGGGANRFYTTRDNIFIGAAQTDVAIGVVTSDGQTPTFELASCRESGNIYNGLSNYGLAIAGSRTLSPPRTISAAASPPLGYELRGEAGAGPGEVDRWRLARLPKGTGMGSTGSGNDAAQWEATLFGSSEAPGFTDRGISQFSTGISTAIAGGIVATAATGKLRSTIDSGGNVATGAGSYPDQAIMGRALVPVRGTRGITWGWTNNIGPSAAPNAPLACVLFDGDTIRVLKRGVIQNALTIDSVTYPNKVAMVTGQLIEIVYNPPAGQADFFITDRDGNRTQFGRWNDSATSGGLTTYVRMTNAREWIFVGAPQPPPG